MNRSEIIASLKKYFDIRELVCPHVYKKYGERSWKFLDTNILYVLLVLRENVFKTSIIINTYHIGGKYSQRGNRCNLCQIVRDKKQLYISGHMLYKAFDFVVHGYDADEARQVIISNSDALPCPVRLECDDAAPTWVHIDVMPSDTGEQVTVFIP